jgi:hypothetical protein
MNSEWFLAALILILVVLFIHNRNYHNQKIKNVDVEIVTSLYKVSWECISKYYYNDVSEDGYVFSFTPPPDDCECEHIEDDVRIIKHDENEFGLKNHASSLFDKLKKSNANASFFESAKLINRETGEVIEDMSEDIRLMDKIENMIPSPPPENNNVKYNV